MIKVQQQLQVPMDPDYMDALELIAKAYGQSRRQYWANYLIKVCDNTPGLMAKVRDKRNAGWDVPEYSVDIDKKQASREPAKVEFKDHFARIRVYLFRYYDTDKGSIEAAGTGPIDAIQNVTGRSWTHEQLLEEFKAPEFVRYQDGEE